MTVDSLRPRFDAALTAFLGSVVGPVDAIADELTPLTETLQGFVLDGGKRLRPSFCYWGYRATGAADDQPIVAAAAALELLQACALVHDDVIDASDTRRGSPSVHRRFETLHRSAAWHGDAAGFGAAAAILLGDLALIWADAMLTGSGFDAVALQRAMPVWEAMRVEVMCGQYLDVVEQARGGGSLDRAIRVARFKSAKYTIERPLHLGAALAGGSDELMKTFSSYGLPLGEAFQLRDDLLGVFGDPAVTGKPAGDDLREGKRTALIALAAERGDDTMRDVLESHLGQRDLDDSGIQELRDVLDASGARDLVEAMIAQRVDEAVQALDTATIDEDARRALLALATTASERDV